MSPGSAGFRAQLKALGKHKLSGSCLHIKRLNDVDVKVLAKLVGESVEKKRSSRGSYVSRQS